MAKKITKYQADDGTEFATEAEADHHDRQIIARRFFRDQFIDTTCIDWDFTMAYVPDDSDVLVVSVDGLSDFLANNAAQIQAAYSIAGLTLVQKPKFVTTVDKVKLKLPKAARKADNRRLP